MDYKALLFRFSGRINRAKYWLVVLVNVLAWVVYAVVIAILMGGISKDALGGATGGSIVVIALMIVVLIFSVWSSLATAMKRLHDRNKSGWWILLFWLVPSVLNGIGQSMGVNGGLGALLGIIGAGVAIWGFVEIACL